MTQGLYGGHGKEQTGNIEGGAIRENKITIRRVGLMRGLETLVISRGSNNVMWEKSGKRMG